MGLAGHGSYRILLDGPGNKVIVSRDVIFEELSPTRTVSLREGEIAYEELIEPLTETIEDHPQPPIDPTDHDRDQPNQMPTAPAQAQPIQPRTIPNPPSKRPSRIPKPTRALTESKEYAQREELAKRQGKDWANNNAVPLLAEEDNVEDIVALKASEISNIVDRHDLWVPDDYHQAMTKAKIWRPAMDAEIWRMEERDVWRVIPREPWMQVIDTRWTFDKKLDGDTAELLK